MPKIIFLPDQQEIRYTANELAYAGEGRPGSLLDLALNKGVNLRHACGGICACVTCHVIIKKGAEHLSPMEHDEEDRIYRIPEYSLHSRLACRAVVLEHTSLETKGPAEIAVLIPSASRAAE